MNRTRIALTTASLLITLPALANGWDWGIETLTRDWRESSLAWAREAHPVEPSPLVLLATTAPPPREIWCTGTTAPTQTDCNIHHGLLEDWTHNYLGLTEAERVPFTLLNNFPSEGAASCYSL